MGLWLLEIIKLQSIVHTKYGGLFKIYGCVVCVEKYHGLSFPGFVVATAKALWVRVVTTASAQTSTHRLVPFSWFLTFSTCSLTSCFLESSFHFYFSCPFFLFFSLHKLNKSESNDEKWENNGVSEYIAWDICNNIGGNDLFSIEDLIFNISL